jgi:hypothetical protein
VVKLSVQGTNRVFLYEMFLVFISGRVCVDAKAILRPTGFCTWKIPVIPPEIEPATFRLLVQCLNQLCPRVLEKKNINYFSAKIYLISVANMASFGNETQTVKVVTARRCSTRKLHVGTDCLQQIRLLEVIAPFVLLLCHAFCLLKNIKSIRELVTFQDKKWYHKSCI